MINDNYDDGDHDYQDDLEKIYDDNDDDNDNDDDLGVVDNGI